MNFETFRNNLKESFIGLRRTSASADWKWLDGTTSSFFVWKDGGMDYSEIISINKNGLIFGEPLFLILF